MKLFSLITLFCTLCIVTAADAGQKSTKTKTITLAVGEWAPLTSQSLPSYGACTEIVTAVFREAGYEPHYQFFPWKRAEEAVEQGTVYASFPYVKTEERQKKFNYSDLLINSPGKFFYLKKNFPQGVNYQKLEELSAYTFGGSIGYWYEEVYRKAKLTVEYVPTDEQNIRKLYSGRIQLFECNELVGWSIISRLYPNEKKLFGVSSQVVEDGMLHLLVSRNYRNSDQITADFNAALARCRSNGTITRIMKKWGMP